MQQWLRLANLSLLKCGDCLISRLNFWSMLVLRLFSDDELEELRVRAAASVP